MIRNLKLETVDFSGNAISKLDSFASSSSFLLVKLGQKTPLTQTLKTLFLASNGFTAFPTAVFELPNLKELDLSKNKLKSLPGNMGELRTLQKLNLEECELEGFPQGIAGLLKLNSLNLSGNALHKLAKFTNQGILTRQN